MEHGSEDRSGLEWMAGVERMVDGLVTDGGRSMFEVRPEMWWSGRSGEASVLVFAGLGWAVAMLGKTKQQTVVQRVLLLRSVRL